MSELDFDGPSIYARSSSVVPGLFTIAERQIEEAVTTMGPSRTQHSERSQMLFVHKASFVLWFGSMTLHVVAHLFDTARLAPADFVTAAGRHAAPVHDSGRWPRPWCSG